MLFRSKGNGAKTAHVAFNATAAAEEDEETNVEEFIVRPIVVRDTSNNSTHSNSSNSSNVDRLAVVTENIEAVQQALVKAVRESYRRKKREIVHKFHGSDGDSYDADGDKLRALLGPRQRRHKSQRQLLSVRQVHFRPLQQSGARGGLWHHLVSA